MRKALAIFGILVYLGVACYAQSDTKVDDDVVVKVKASLTDGSSLLGTPYFTSLTLATDFGKPQIPLALVSTLDIGRDGVKVTFVNKDVLSGTLEDSAFKIAASFGDVTLEYAQIRTMTFSLQRSAAQGEAGLLLHVPLNRVDENLDIFDARMETKNVRIVDGERGRAMAFDPTASNAKATIQLPFSPYTMNEGTIEFYGRVPNPYQSPSGNGLEFFNVASDGYTYNNQFTLFFALNGNLRGKSGLTGTLPGLHAATHDPYVITSVASTGLFGDTPDGLQHYAFIWKRDGVDFSGYKGKKLLLAVDGKIVASTEASAELHDYSRDFSKSLDSNPRLYIPCQDINKSPRLLPFEMSDLKIWNYAKLPEIKW